MNYTVKEMRRQGTDWENIFAKDTIGKGLLSKIPKELLKLSNKKMSNLIKKKKKWTEDIERNLTKEDIQMQRYSTSCVIRKLQIKKKNEILQFTYYRGQIQNTDKHQMPARMRSNWNSHLHSLLVEIQDGTDTLEVGLAAFCKTKHSLAI